MVNTLTTLITVAGLRYGIGYSENVARRDFANHIPVSVCFWEFVSSILRMPPVQGLICPPKEFPDTYRRTAAHDEVLILDSFALGLSPEKSHRYSGSEGMGKASFRPAEG